MKIRKISKQEALDCINTLILFYRQKDKVIINEEIMLENMEDRIKKMKT